MDRRIILASASQRRYELLKLMGLDFQVAPSGADENIPPMAPEKYVMTLAKRKAQDVFYKNPDAVVIGADTVVVLDGAIIGKPKDENDAYAILRRLGGNIHTVYSGVAVLTRGSEDVRFDKTDVHIAKLSDAAIWNYIKTGDPMDKAGAYGVQGPFCVNVTRIKGSFFTVVGLPVHLLNEMLQKIV